MWFTQNFIQYDFQKDPADHEPDKLCSSILCQVQTLVCGFYRGGNVQEGTMVRPHLTELVALSAHQEGLGSYIVSTCYLNKFRKTRASLPTFWPWHILTSKGPGVVTPREVILWTWNGILCGQRWNPYCQYAYVLFFRCLNPKVITMQKWHILASAFSLCLHVVEEARDLSGTSFYEGISPIP